MILYANFAESNTGNGHMEVNRCVFHMCWISVVDKRALPNSTPADCAAVTRISVAQEITFAPYQRISVFVCVCVCVTFIAVHTKHTRLIMTYISRRLRRRSPKQTFRLERTVFPSPESSRPPRSSQQSSSSVGAAAAKLVLAQTKQIIK